MEANNRLLTSRPGWVNLRSNDIIYQYGDRIVYKIRKGPDEFILKRTAASRHQSEAATHQFLAERTAIPAPIAYGEWLSSDRRYHYLLEGHIAGQTLGDCWGQLSMDDKIDIAEQITAYMSRLSRFTSDRMQSISGTRLPNNCFVARPADPRGHLSGRWTSDDDIFQYEFRPALVRSGVSAELIGALRRAMPPCRGELAFTHCDLYVGNIMVDPRRGRVTAIIDWESAGFWPEWFQYARITHGCSRDDTEWKWILSQVQQPTIRHADHGRVWWDTMQTFMYCSDSLQAKAWLRLLGQYLRGEKSSKALKDYQKIDGEGMREQIARDEARLMRNNRGGTGNEGYYSTVIGRF
ncbi:kinase-like domain-containing protein [Chaetomidium leptoderma]|uniref:Kinase-like domain-containing protein n=1 Tax=Chaetomidium leptoderma TaxID=669021 RepID=A0AAN6VIN9_9PEZI|nr:kinase-like domain-containing protein [Chaetomidium leptoderma]